MFSAILNILNSIFKWRKELCRIQGKKIKYVEESIKNKELKKIEIFNEWLFKKNYFFFFNLNYSVPFSVTL